VSIIRTERASVLWAKESTFGSLPVSGWKRFGIHEVVNVADPEYEWYPYFGIFSTRGRQTILRGRQSFRGAVPDIRMQGGNAGILEMILGKKVGDDYQDDFRGVTIPFPSFTMAVGLRDTDGYFPLIRDYLGGRVNRATIFANEGEELRIGLDEILFKDMIHTSTALAYPLSGHAKYSASATVGTDPGPSAAGRFMFSSAEIQILGLTVAHVRRFSLTVDNQIEAKYYLARADSADGAQHPKDLVPGKQVYRLETELDLSDPNIDRNVWEFLLDQGATTWPGPTLGGQIYMQFNTMGDTGSTGQVFTIICSTGGFSTTHPGSVLLSAPAHIPAPPTGLVPQMATWDVSDVTIYAN
jgi:hypothetical protein